MDIRQTDPGGLRQRLSQVLAARPLLRGLLRALGAGGFCFVLAGAGLLDGPVPLALAPVCVLPFGPAAICAYLGCLRGHHTILDSVSDPVIGPIVYRAMQQSGAGLVKKFSMDEQKHQAYIDRIFARFHNPYLQDEVARVGREPIRKLAASDRLINPLLTAYNFGMKVDQLIFGAAAALRYDNAEDPQSVELHKTIAEQGAAAALEQYSGLAADHPLSTRILDVYRALAV